MTTVIIATAIRQDRSQDHRNIVKDRLQNSMPVCSVYPEDIGLPVEFKCPIWLAFLVFIGLRKLIASIVVIAPSDEFDSSDFRSSFTVRFLKAGPHRRDYSS